MAFIDKLIEFVRQRKAKEFLTAFSRLDTEKQWTQMRASWKQVEDLSAVKPEQQPPIEKAMRPSAIALVVSLVISSIGVAVQFLVSQFEPVLQWTLFWTGVQSFFASGGHYAWLSLVLLCFIVIISTLLPYNLFARRSKLSGIWYFGHHVEEEVRVKQEATTPPLLKPRGRKKASSR